MIRQLHRRDIETFALALATVVVWGFVGCSVPGTSTEVHMALDGAHATISCATCHVEGLEAPLPDTCAGCHEDVRPPAPHPDGACEDCHGTTSWDQLDVDHSFFPLASGHGGLECTDCHGASDYYSLDPTCSSCHEVDRPADHDPGECSECHTIESWDAADIDHDLFLSLAGGHAPLQCSECHDAGTYLGLDNTCASCHVQDKPNNHFGGTCDTCHDVFSWDDAEFLHSAVSTFPKGHDQQGGVCTNCHVEDNGYATFSCIDCHEHDNRNEMANEHRGENGYRYESAACFDCHPRGED